MGKQKGKTPSLITMSTGKPTLHTCGRTTLCERCGKEVATGTACFQIPKMKNGFTTRPIFCMECTFAIVLKTKTDIHSLEETLEQYS